MTLSIWALEGIGEIVAGDDLAAVIVQHLAQPLHDGDVVVVTSKVISKAAGLATRGDRDELLESQTDRVVARRGPTRIVRTHGGLTLAAAGIDASNIAAGTVIALPADPDAAAHEIRAGLRRLAGVDVGVVITDTAGRAWRIGQTDIAIGAAGVLPALSFDGVEDAYGNMLAVTAPAIADEIAAASDLVAGKLGGRPVVVVRGLPAQWLDGAAPGATSLIRDEDGDLFGLGARDAVLAAAGYEEVVRGFPSPEAGDDLLALAREGIDPTLAVVRDVGSRPQVSAVVETPEAYVEVGRLTERLRILGRALRQG